MLAPLDEPITGEPDLGIEDARGGVEHRAGERAGDVDRREGGRRDGGAKARFPGRAVIAVQGLAHPSTSAYSRIFSRPTSYS